MTSSGSHGMSLQNQTAGYRPGMHTTVLQVLVVNVNMDFFKKT